MARRSASRAAPPPYVPPPNAVDGKRKPVHTLRIMSVRASIWSAGPDQGPPFTLSVDRQWREPDGQWRESHVFESGDLQHLARAASEARQWIQWQERRLAPAAAGPV